MPLEYKICQSDKIYWPAYNGQLSIGRCPSKVLDPFEAIFNEKYDLFLHTKLVRIWHGEDIISKTQILI